MGPGWTALVEGGLAGYGIAIPVGAVAILIVNTAIQCGFPTGFMAGAGAATADFIYALIASLAGVAVAAALEPFAMPLRIASGLVLMALAVVGLIGVHNGSISASASTAECPPLTMYFRFLGITLINPLTVVYFTAFILGRGTAALGYSPFANAAFVLGAGLASLSWQSLLAALGGLAGRHLTARFRTFATVSGNLLVLVLGVRVLVGALA